jgi:YYY domain-containing protein
VLDAFIFWLLAEALGLVGLPVAAIVFRRLPGNGLAFARPLGLLLVGYPLWLLVSVNAIPYTHGAAIAVTVCAAVASATLAIGTLRPKRLGAAPVRLWVVGELLFCVIFAGCALLRSFAPEVLQTEKPMDMAIVNSLNASDTFPPHDPWLSGSTLNYYYFGHYLNALLIRLTGVDPAVGYNLAVALFSALTVTSVYGAGSALYLALRKESHAPTVPAIVPGLAAAAFAMVGNLAGGIRWLHHPATVASYDWFAPSRVIPHTANEFPFFSFLLGDLHAHTLAAPFALLALAFTMQVCLAGAPRPRRLSASTAMFAAELMSAALAVGALYATNSLDYPTAVALAVLGTVLWTLSRPQSWLLSLVWGALWLGASVVLFLPFWTHFDPTTSGLGLVQERTHFSEFLKNGFLIYGLPLWVFATLIARRRGAPFKYAAWGTIAIVLLLVLLSPRRLSNVVVVFALAAGTMFLALGGRRPQSERLIWLLLSTAFALAGIGEFAYVRDSFDATPSFRFNTVFKAGYQAWFLFAILAACVLFWSRGWWSGRIRALWHVGFAFLAALALVYPVVGTYSRSRGFAATPTLDGMAWLKRSSPGDATAIQWLRRHVAPTATVLETVGPDFDPSGAARVSTFTGRATVLGWAGHEIQWGHDPRSRREDVERIYRTRDIRVARRLLTRYDVSYVFIGSLERKAYPPQSLEKFRRLGATVFSRNETTVYRIRTYRRPATRPAGNTVLQATAAGTPRR